MEKSPAETDGGHRFPEGSIAGTLQQVSRSLASLAVILDDLSRLPALRPFEFGGSVRE
jgi:hypothetical protein